MHLVPRGKIKFCTFIGKHSTRFEVLKLRPVSISANWLFNVTNEKSKGLLKHQWKTAKFSAKATPVQPQNIITEK